MLKAAAPRAAPTARPDFSSDVQTPFKKAPLPLEVSLMMCATAVNGSTCKPANEKPQTIRDRQNRIQF